MQRLRLFFVYRETGYMLIKIRHAGISVWRISYGFYSYPGPIGIYTWSSGDFGAAFVVSGTVSGAVFIRRLIARDYNGRRSVDRAGSR